MKNGAVEDLQGSSSLIGGDAGNRLHGDEFPSSLFGIGLLDEGAVADGIALFIEGNVAGDAGVGHLGQRGHHSSGIGGTSQLQGFQSHVVSIIAHGRDGCDDVVAAVVVQVVRVGVDELFEASLELGVAALSIEGGDIDIHVLTLGSGQHHVGVPSVGAQQGFTPWE